MKNKLNVNKPKIRLSKLKISIISAVSLAAIATPATLITLKFMPDFMNAAKKEDKKAYNITRQTINDKGQEEITLKTKYDSFEVDGAIKITKGDVELKCSADPETQNNLLTSSETNSANGDYYFDKKNQTFIIFKKTLDKIPGIIHIEPRIIEKTFICRIERPNDSQHKNNPNLIFGDTNTRYPIRFYKDGNDISTDINDPVNVSLAGKSGEAASIVRDDKGFSYLVIKDADYFGKITLTATRYNHKLVDENGDTVSTILLEVGSYDKLSYDLKDNKEINVGLNKATKTSNVESINVAIPNRWWIPSETNPNIGDWHTVTGIRDYGFANTNKDFINLKIHDFDSIEKTTSDPNKITHIGKAAFSNNSKLRSIDLSNLSCKNDLADKDSENPGLFEGCSNLSSDRKLFKLPQAAQKIPKGAFIGCNNFTDLDFLLNNESVTEIGDEAFKDCKNLGCIDSTTSVAITFPKQLKKIGKAAFFNCNKIKTIEINCNINSIGEECFSTDNHNGKESPITSVKFLGGNDDIHDTTGNRRSDFEVGKNAFANNKISNILLDSVVVARSKSFITDQEYKEGDITSGNDSGLFDEFGKSLTHVEINKINVSDEIKKLESDGGAYTSYFNRHFECRGKEYDKDYNNHEVRLSEYIDFEFEKDDDNATISLKENPVYCPSEIDIPSTYSLIRKGNYKDVKITKIKEGGFAKNDKGDISRNKIEKISFKNNSFITDIPESAFNGQASLTTIKFNGDKKYSVGGGAFNGCSSISDNNIFKYLNKLNGPNIFNGTQITSADLKNITDIYAPTAINHDGVFKGMSKLKSIINIGNTSYKRIKNYTFNNCQSVKKIKISLPLLSTSIIEKNAFRGLGEHDKECEINLKDNYKYWALCKDDGSYDKSQSYWWLKGDFSDIDYYNWTQLKNGEKANHLRWRSLSKRLSLYIAKGTQQGSEDIYSDSTGNYYGYYYVDNNVVKRNYRVFAECFDGTLSNELGCETNLYGGVFQIDDEGYKGNRVLFHPKENTQGFSGKIVSSSKDNRDLKQTLTFDIAIDYRPTSKNVEYVPYTGEEDGLKVSFDKILELWYWFRKAFHTLQENNRTLSFVLKGKYPPLITDLYLRNANRRAGLLYITSFAFNGYGRDYKTQIKIGDTINVYLQKTTCGMLDIIVCRDYYYEEGGEQIFLIICQAG